MFQPPPLEAVQRSYPGFEGPLFVHSLQDHIVGEVVWPMLEDRLDHDDVVVDLGCGSGSMVRRMREQVTTAIGIDVDDGAFSKFPELTVVDDGARNLHERPGGFLVHADLGSVPLPDGVVDLVTSRWVFEHLADPGAAVAEIRRLLRPGGLALLVVPNRLHPGILLSSLFPVKAKQLVLRATGGIEEKLVLPTYYRANTERDLDRLFGGHGFEKVAFASVRDPSYWLFSRALFRAATALGSVSERVPLERFRMHLVALYRKAGPSEARE